MFNKNEIAIIMALPSESAGLFEASGFPIYYCGIGKVNAAIKTTEVILKHKPRHVFNLGSAGSHVFATHTLLECTEFVQRDIDVSPLGFPIGTTPLDEVPALLVTPALFADLPKGRCGTADIFETSAPKIACDLVEMEAYAVAKACYIHKMPFTALKYITDGSDDASHEDWGNNVPLAAKALHAALLQLLA